MVCRPRKRPRLLQHWRRPQRATTHAPTGGSLAKHTQAPVRLALPPQAAADLYGTRITLITSFAEKFVLAIEPFSKMTNKVLYLSFWAESHYNSVYPAGEVPPEPPAPPVVAPPPATKFLGSKKLGKLGAIFGQ